MQRLSAWGFSVFAFASATSATAQELARDDTADGVVGQVTQTAAADLEQPSDDEIIVTAQRRAENAQDVPISLTVLSAEELARTAIDNVLDLPRVVPSFYAFRASQAANTRLSIRGIGSSGNSSIEPSVAAFVDGIYVPRPGPLLATLNDVAAVEVLRGPQGTLFGRNASMGAIVIRTRDPNQELSGELNGEAGSYGRLRGSAIVNTPVTDRLAARASFLYDEFDGFGQNTLTDEHFGELQVFSARAALKAELTPTLSWLIKGDYQRQRGDGFTPTSVVAETVTPTALSNWRTRSGDQLPIVDETYTYRNRADTDGLLRDRQWGLASDLSLELEYFTVRLLSGYRDWSYYQQEDDVTNTPANFYGRIATFDSRSHSHEVQFASPAEGLFGDRLAFVAGLYYFREDYIIGEDVNLGPDWCTRIIGRAQPTQIPACLALPQQGATRYDFDQRTQAYAAFAQATFSITPQIDLTAGVRYSYDEKDADLLVQRNNRFATVRAPDSVEGLEFDGGKVTWRANVTYRPQSDVMLFATYSTGYKSGGFDAGNGASLGANRLFDPETTTNYELGIKSQFIDDRLTLNATLFRTDIEDFQLRSFNGETFSVRNAGSIRQQGLEFDVSARPVRGFSLGLAATYLDSEYTDFRNAPGLPAFGGVQDATGSRATFSPEWQGVLKGSYETALGPSGLGLQISSYLSFQSSMDVGGAGDGNPQTIEPAYQVLGGRIAIMGPQDQWEAYLSGENLTETGYCVLRFAQVLNAPLGLNDPVTGGTVQRCVLGEPLQVRVGVKIRL